MRLIFFLLIFVSFVELRADLSRDYLLLDGTEEIHNIGMDTTHHWWAVTKPFTGQYRLIIDGIRSESYAELTYPVFSPDGERWAFFAKDNVQWYLVTDDSVMILPGTDPGAMEFSPNSQHLVYSYYEAGDEYIVWKNRVIRVYQRFGRYYLSNNSERIAFIGKRAGGYVINVNGKESIPYDTVIVAGFWYDGRIVYAGRNGFSWQVYKGEESITDPYINIRELTINLYGTVAGCLASSMSGQTQGVLFSDEYYEPLITRPYPVAANFILHPELPMMAFSAEYEGEEIVVLNATEYAGGEDTGYPHFTYDGSELYYVGCRIDCFVNINGRRYDVYTGLTWQKDIAVKPKSRTIAYCTSTSLVMQYLDRKMNVAGMMVDATIDPRYNWREGRYETLGILNNRLYLMTINY